MVATVRGVARDRVCGVQLRIIPICTDRAARARKGVPRPARSIRRGRLDGGGQAASGSPGSTSERIRSGRPARTAPSASAIMTATARPRRVFIFARPRTKWPSKPKLPSRRELIRSSAARGA